MVDRIITYVVALISGLALFSSCCNDDAVDASLFASIKKPLLNFNIIEP